MEQDAFPQDGKPSPEHHMANPSCVYAYQRQESKEPVVTLTALLSSLAITDLNTPGSRCVSIIGKACEEIRGSSS